jgi:hypothetical protein
VSDRERQTEKEIEEIRKGENNKGGITNNLN